MTTFYEKLDIDAIQEPPTVSYWNDPCRDPAFPITIVSSVPFGPIGFQKVTCSMEIGSFSVFLCSMFHLDVFFLYNNLTVNDQPLSPPI